MEVLDFFHDGKVFLLPPVINSLYCLKKKLSSERAIQNKTETQLSFDVMYFSRIKMSRYVLNDVLENK